MRILAGWIGLILLSVLPGSVVIAQSNAGAVWSDLEARNPPGLDFSLRLTDPQIYHESQLIRAAVRFRSANPAPAQEPPPERWQFAGFLLDPATDCGSFTSPCIFSAPPRPTVGFDKSDPMLRFAQSPDSLQVYLNTYLPRLRPGRYRLAMLARKLLLAHASPYNTYLYAEPPEYAVSTIVEIEVEPATKAWEDQAIAGSVSILKGPVDDYEQRGMAAQQLRILDTPESWSASLAVLPSDESILLRGLATSREPLRVCQLMQAAVPASSQAVSSYYVREMAGICAEANLPPPPPNRPLKPGEKPGQPSAEQTQYWARFREYQQDVIGNATASLAASLGRKQGEAKTTAFQTLIARVQEIRNTQPKQAVPAWIAAVKAEFIKSFAEIDVSSQSQLLGLYAATLRSPDFAPLLESAMDAWKPGDYYEPARAALQSLYAIDPARARTRIVAEVKRARTWLDESQLELLPASAAPFTNDELFEALAGAQRAGGWNTALRMAALARYATPEARPRMQALYESQKDSCQPELMAYFVRVDPDYADRIFHSHPWDIRVEPPRCIGAYFARTPPIAMGPVLERYLAAYLMQGTVPLKRIAAQSLARFGSAAAAEPLWNAFRYFHDYWKGKETELAKNREGMFLEIDLRNAIARARHWIATDADLRTIASLCISTPCKAETAQDLVHWTTPLTIDVVGWSGAVHGGVAQYSGIESVEALGEKLAQFPKGTRFSMAIYGAGTDAAAADIRSYADSLGLMIEDR